MEEGEKNLMAYADKCFYFDWGDRKIKLEDFDIYDRITLRKRYIWGDEPDAESKPCVSIELWGKNNPDGNPYDDAEIVLTRDNAMILASKLQRAVAELDADDYRANELHDLSDLKHLHDRELEELEDKRMEAKLAKFTDRKGGLGGAIDNYLDTQSTLSVSVKNPDVAKELMERLDKDGIKYSVTGGGEAQDSAEETTAE